MLTAWGTRQLKRFWRGMVLYNCKHCQKEFSRSPSRNLGGYCSRECFAIVRYKAEMRVCPNCGGEKSQSSPGVCMPCRSIVYKKGKEIPCKHCGKKIYWTPSKPRVFCGHKCFGLHRLGAANPAYIDGKAQVPYTSQFRSAAREVRKREGQMCFLCSAIGRLDVHHINRNVSDNTMGNLVALCRPCHMRQRGTPEKMIELSNQMYLKLHHRYCYPILSIT